MLGVLPWFQPLIKSLELPGGLKIELQDVKEATEKIESAREIPAPDHAIQQDESFSVIKNVAEQDPNLALVGIRIELEKRLRGIAQATDISTERMATTALLRELERRQLIPGTVA